MQIIGLMVLILYRTNSWNFIPGLASPPNQNQPPVAVAGPDQSVNSGDTVTLNGTGSYDPDPGDSIVSYQWSSSNSSITLNGADTPTPTFTAPNVDKDTTFTIQLVVTDTHGAQSQPDTVDVLVKAPLCSIPGATSTTTNREAAPSNLTIPSSPSSPSAPTITQTNCPIADAGPNQRVNSGSQVQLDGSRSTPAGQISFAWTPVTANAPQLTGPNTVNPTFRAPYVENQATYRYQLVVSSGGKRVYRIVSSSLVKLNRLVFLIFICDRSVSKATLLFCF